jgi:hypothetical protein
MDLNLPRVLINARMNRKKRTYTSKSVPRLTPSKFAISVARFGWREKITPDNERAKIGIPRTKFLVASSNREKPNKNKNPKTKRT